MIKAIAFDVGGVLALGRFSFGKETQGKGVHDFMRKKLKIDGDSWFDSIDTVYADSIVGKVSEAETLEVMARNLRIDRNKLESLFLRAFRKNFKRNNFLYKLAFDLRKKYKIGILSDQWWISKKALIDKNDEKRFDFSVVSCSVGMRKPNLKIYRMALKKSGVKPGEMVFVDNREWNIIPAKKLGMKTILFKNNKQCKRDLKKLGVEI